MTCPIDENALREALQAALGEVHLDGVRFEALASSARRRRLFGVTAGSSLGVAMTAGLSGLVWLTGQPAPLSAGSAPIPSFTESAPASPSAARSPFPTSSPTAVSSPSRPAGTPGGVADGSRYCPPSDAGKIDWPAVDNQWFASSTAWNGPGHGAAIPFTATQVIICRYGRPGTLAGAGVVTDPAAVRSMQNAVNGATEVATTDPCQIDEMTYVFFTAGTRAAFFTFDLSTCDAWMMPQGVSVTGPFAGDLRRFSTNTTR
jgi:hypothetical protein